MEGGRARHSSINMDTIEKASSRIRECGIVPIIRGDYSTDDMLRIGDALLAGDVTVMEVTLNSTSALDALPKLRAHFKKSMLIGAGTVRNVSHANQAVNAGAQFLISPNLDIDTVRFSREAGLLHLPGVFTATEAQMAFIAGCRLLKLFPMEAAGPAYLKALRAPLNDIDFVPTGGISLENITEYARAGAVAVGMGSKLVLSRDQAPEDLTTRAKALRRAWQEAKHG
jgi:2-dehydro-3-deoxyphosphogluconate aldolase/(4S)-4-hydroxy-2-oxoglutarate aldolase